MSSADYNIKTSQILQKLQLKLQKYFTPKYQAQNNPNTSNFRQVMSKCERLKSYHKSAVEENQEWLDQIRKKQFNQNQKKLRINTNIKKQGISACEQKLTFMVMQHKKQQVQKGYSQKNGKETQKEQANKNSSLKNHRLQNDASKLILQKLQMLQNRIDKLQIKKSKNYQVESAKYKNNKSHVQKKSQSNKSKRNFSKNSKQKSIGSIGKKGKTQNAISSVSIVKDSSEFGMMNSNITPSNRLKKVGAYYNKKQTKKGQFQKKVNNRETSNGESQVKSIFSLLPRVRSAGCL